MISVGCDAALAQGATAAGSGRLVAADGGKYELFSFGFVVPKFGSLSSAIQCPLYCCIGPTVVPIKFEKRLESKVLGISIRLTPLLQVSSWI